MTNRPALRFWIEIALAAMGTLALVMTVTMPDWIERIFEFDPDGGDGSTEWVLAISLAVITAIFVADARRLWSRSTQASASTK